MIILLAAMLALMPTAVTAQSAPPVNTTMDDGTRRGTTPSATQCITQTGAWGACTNPARQETFQLVGSNTASAAATAYGGNYIWTQACTAYGTVSLRYRSPDGSTMITLVTRSGPEVSGTVIQLGSAQVVDAVLSGTTGCNATLSRIP
jgi:hypothetical protein